MNEAPWGGGVWIIDSRTLECPGEQHLSLVTRMPASVKKGRRDQNPLGVGWFLREMDL